MVDRKNKMKEVQQSLFVINKLRDEALSNICFSEGIIVFIQKLSYKASVLFIRDTMGEATCSRRWWEPFRSLYALELPI